MNVSILARTDVLGVIVGVIGIILAFVFYFRSKEKSKPCYAVARRVLIGTPNSSLPSGIEITYEGRKISSLSRTLIYFWNRGAKTLDREDVASSDPIVFHFDGEGVEVLEIRSIKVNRSVVNPSATQNGNRVELSFDFLDRRDGVVIEVFHNGTEARVRCEGTIKGVPKGIVRQAAEFLPDGRLSLSSGWIPPKETLAGFGGAAFGLVLGLSITLNTGNKLRREHWFFNYGAYILGITITIFALILLVGAIFMYREERIRFWAGYMRDDG